MALFFVGFIAWVVYGWCFCTWFMDVDPQGATVRALVARYGGMVLLFAWAFALIFEAWILF